MLPLLNDDGNLPPGIQGSLHEATWEEVRERFGRNPHRLKLLHGVGEVLRLLRAAGCGRVYLDGSFVTRKVAPGDFDLGWDEKDVNETVLEPIFLDFTHWTLPNGARRKSGALGARFTRPMRPAASAAGRIWIFSNAPSAPDALRGSSRWI